VVAALILQNQSVLRSRYRRQTWTIQDQIQALSCGLAALAYLAVLILWPDQLSFYPYPRLHWPDFQPALGLFFLILTGPAWLILWRKP
jgi:hypothetical protein